MSSGVSAIADLVASVLTHKSAFAQQRAPFATKGVLQKSIGMSLDLRSLLLRLSQSFAWLSLTAHQDPDAQF